MRIAGCYLIKIVKVYLIYSLFKILRCQRIPLFTNKHYVEGWRPNESMDTFTLNQDRHSNPTGKAEEEYRGCENIYYVN